MLIKDDPFKAILEILLGNLLAEHNLIYGFLLMEFLFRLQLKEFRIRIRIKFAVSILISGSGFMKNERENSKSKQTVKYSTKLKSIY